MGKVSNQYSYPIITFFTASIKSDENCFDLIKFYAWSKILNQPLFYTVKKDCSVTILILFEVKTKKSTDQDFLSHFNIFALME